MKFLLLSFVVALVTLSRAQDSDYAPRLQPELDSIDVDSYLQNQELFNLQMNCVLYDGPCDNIGKWLKPRIASALVGTCIKCTEKQESDVAKILTYIIANRPDLYRLAVSKYLQVSDTNVPADEAKKV